MNIKLDKCITLIDAPTELIEALQKELIIDNPKYLQSVKYGSSKFKPSKKLSFMKATSKGDILLPKGFINRLMVLVTEITLPNKINKATGIEYIMTSIPKRYFVSNIKLHQDQVVACNAMLNEQYGVLQAPTGSGKTVMAIKLIEARKELALIVVHTKELLYQWRDRLLEFTDLTIEQVGLIGDGRTTNYKNKIIVGIINSLNKQSSEIFKYVGMVVIDECHRVPSTVFTKFLGRLNCKYMLGLSATPYRNDGLDKVINFYLGETLHKIELADLIKTNRIMKAKLRVIDTNFVREVKSPTEYPEVMKDLVNNWDRNWLIANTVLHQYGTENGSILVISDRVEHCIKLADMMYELDLPYCLLVGKSNNKTRQEVREAMNTGKTRILIATGQLIGEGFDLDHLSSIFLCMPIKYHGRLTQYIGRIFRIAEGKEKATIFDFNDKCWLLQNSLRKRMDIYRSLGIRKET